MDGIGPDSPVAAICPAVEPTGRRTMRAAWLVLAALLSVASSSGYHGKGGGEGQNDAACFNELQYNYNRIYTCNCRLSGSSVVLAEIIVNKILHISGFFYHSHIYLPH